MSCSFSLSGEMQQSKEGMIPSGNNRQLSKDGCSQSSASAGPSWPRSRHFLPSPKRKRAPLPPSFHDPDDIKLTLSDEDDTDHVSGSCPNLHSSSLGGSDQLRSGHSNSAAVLRALDELSPRQRTYAFSVAHSETDWILNKPVKLWTRQEVQVWASSVGVEDILKHLPDLDGEDLVDFSEQGIGNLDIKNIALHNKFEKGLQKLRSHNPMIEISRKSPKCISDIDVNNQAGSKFLLRPKNSGTDIQETLGSGGGHRGSAQENTTMSGRSTPDYTRVQVRLWTNAMVLEWLDSVGLDKFKHMFKAKNITGEQLVNIDIKLLDDMHICTTSDREEILASIYHLMSNNNGSNQNLQRSDSGCSLAKVEPLTRSSSAGSTPPLSPSPRTPPVIDKSVIVKQDSGKKKKKGLHKLKEKMAPKIFGTRSKDNGDCVHIWNNLASQDSMSTTPVKASESTTCAEVINTLLDQHEITDDFNLYYMVESAVDPEQDIFDRELGKFECPLFVQQQWSSPPSHRLELHKRRGIQIKVVYHISGMRQRGKSFSLSDRSTSEDALKTALRKIRLRHVDATLFCLMQINKENGDITHIEEEDIIVSLPSDCFVLCDQVNRESLCEDRQVTESVTSVVRRNSSLVSHGSTLSGNSIGSANSLASSSSGGLSPRLHSTAEGQVVDSNEQSAHSSHTTDVLEDGCLPCSSGIPQQDQMRKSKGDQTPEDNKNILKLQTDYQELVIKTRQLCECQHKLNETERLVQETELKYRCKLDGLKKQLALPWHQGSWEVFNLQVDVENVTCEVEAKARLIEELRKDLQSDMSDLGVAERQHRLSVHQTSLVRIKQKLCSLQEELDMALHKQQSSPTNLSSLVDAGCSKSLCMLVLPSSDEITVSPGCHGETVIDSFPSGCGLKQGDRILEVDSINVMLLTTDKIETLLNNDKPIRVLVLRDKEPIRATITEDVSCLKAELSLAHQQLEFAQKDNTELLQKNEKILTQSEKYEKEHKILKDQVASLNKKLKQWDDRWRDLRSTLLDMKSSDIDTLPLTLSPKSCSQPQKTRVKDHELSQMKNMLTHHASHIARLQESLRAKDLAIEVLYKEKEGILEKLKGQENSALSYEELEGGVPLWVSLKKSTKESVLQALKDNIVQNAKQKAYLDRLLAVVIEQAPHLLEAIETDELEQVMDGSTQDAAWC